MARPWRIQLADAWYHVMSRGNAGQTLFVGDADHRRFLGLVSELPERFAFEVHGFVLRDNHYHLLLRTRRADLSGGMAWLNVAYTVRFNRAHRRRGHVLQGRFKAVLIRDESRLDEVARYLHLNPVRVEGLGLGKAEQRRARVSGCADPGAELEGGAGPSCGLGPGCGVGGGNAALGLAPVGGGPRDPGTEVQRGRPRGPPILGGDRTESGGGPLRQSDECPIVTCIDLTPLPPTVLRGHRSMRCLSLECGMVGMAKNVPR